MDTRGALRNAVHCAFWLSVPLTLAAMLLWPRRSVIYVGSLDLNPVVSDLPPPLDELWYFYPATLLSVAVLAICTIARRSGRPYQAWPERLPTFFLPTYLAGIESIGLFLWSMRCHSWTAPPSLTEVVANGVLLSGTACSIAIVAGAVAASAFGHRSRGVLPVPIVVIPIVACVMLQWWLVWSVFQPR